MNEKEFADLIMDLREMSVEELQELEKEWQQVVEQKRMSPAAECFAKKAINIILEEKRENKMKYTYDVKTEYKNTLKKTTNPHQKV